jgi:hypothetical protein
MSSILITLALMFKEEDAAAKTYATRIKELQKQAKAEKLDRDAVSELVTPAFVKRYGIVLNEKGLFTKADKAHQACKAARNYLLNEVFPKPEGAAPAESGRAAPLTRDQKAAVKAFLLAFDGVKATAIAAVRAA